MKPEDVFSCYSITPIDASVCVLPMCSMDTAGGAGSDTLLYGYPWCRWSVPVFPPSRVTQCFDSLSLYLKCHGMIHLQHLCSQIALVSIVTVEDDLLPDSLFFVNRKQDVYISYWHLCGHTQRESTGIQGHLYRTSFFNSYFLYNDITTLESRDICQQTRM